MMERFKFDIFRADDFGRFASVQGQSGQSQFAPLKLRSIALVPSSGAQSAPTNSTYGSSTARIFPPGSATQVRYSRSFRSPAPPADMRPSSANRDGIPVPGTVPTSGQPAAAPLSPLRPPSWGWRLLPLPPSSARATPSPSSWTRPSPTTAASSWSSKHPKASATAFPALTPRPWPSKWSRSPTPQQLTSVPTTWPSTAPPGLRPRRSSSATTSSTPAPAKSPEKCSPWLLSMRMH